MLPEAMSITAPIALGGDENAPFLCHLGYIHSDPASILVQRSILQQVAAARYLLTLRTLRLLVPIETRRPGRSNNSLWQGFGFRRLSIVIVFYE